MPLTRPGPDDLMDEAGKELDVVLDEYADAIEAGAASVGALTDAVNAQTWLNSITAAIVGGATRRVTFALGGPGNQTYANQTVDFCTRFRTVLPVNAKRWRLRIRNKATRAGTDGVGTIAVQAYYGTPGVGGSGATFGAYRWDGTFTAAPTALAFSGAASAAMVGGAEVVTDWVDGVIVEGVPVAFSIGFGLGGASCTMFGDQVGGVCRQHSTAFTGAGAASFSSTGLFANPVGDVRLEYEYYDRTRSDGRPEVQTLLVLGDSIAVPQAQDVTGQPGMMSTCEGWPVRGAYANRWTVVDAAIGATRLTNGAGTGWTQATTLAHAWLGDRFDLVTTLPDAALIELGINDLANSITVATMQTDFATIVAQLRAMGIPRIFAATVLPGGNGLPTTVDFSGTTFGASWTSGQPDVTLTAGHLRGVPVGLPVVGTGVPSYANGGYIESILTETRFRLGGNTSASAGAGTAITLGSGSAHIDTDANEANRRKWNQWVRGLPCNINGVFDVAKLIQAPERSAWADGRYMREYPHMLREGHQVAAMAVRL